MHVITDLIKKNITNFVFIKSNKLQYSFHQNIQYKRRNDQLHIISRIKMMIYSYISISRVGQAKKRWKLKLEKEKEKEKEKNKLKNGMATCNEERGH